MGRTRLKKAPFIGAIVLSFACTEDAANDLAPLPPTVVTFTAADFEVESGTSTTLSWVTEGAERVEVMALDGRSLVEDGPASGVINTGPLSTSTEFILIALGVGGTRDASLTVVVEDEPPLDPPSIASFVAVPDVVIRGEPTELRWQTERASKVDLSSEDGRPRLNEGLPNGTVMLALDETTRFTLVATGSDGRTDRQNLTVEVVEPISVSFWVEPESIPEGDSATLRWQVLNADRVTVRNERMAVIAETEDLEGALQVTPESGRGTKTYRLTASRNLPFQTLTREVSLEVTPRVPIFIVSPNRIRAGESATLRWRIVNADRARILENGIVLVDGPELAGEIIVSPSASANYLLLAVSGGRTTEESGVRLIVEP